MKEFARTLFPPCPCKGVTTPPFAVWSWSGRWQGILFLLPGCCPMSLSLTRLFLVLIVSVLSCFLTSKCSYMLVILVLCGREGECLNSAIFLLCFLKNSFIFYGFHFDEFVTIQNTFILLNSHIVFSQNISNHTVYI